NADDLVNANGGWDVWYGATPKDRLSLLDRVTKRRQVVQNIFTEINLTNNLKLRTSYSIQNNDTKNNTFAAKRLDTFLNRNSATIGNVDSNQTIFENTLTYSPILDENNTLGVI